MYNKNVSLGSQIKPTGFKSLILIKILIFAHFWKTYIATGNYNFFAKIALKSPQINLSKNQMMVLKPQDCSFKKDPIF